MQNVTAAAEQDESAAKGKVYNRKALLKSVVEKTGLPRPKALVAIEAVFDSIRGSLKDGVEVRVAKFGSFSMKDRKAHKRTDPKTGAMIDVPAKKAVRFRAGKALRHETTETAA